MLGWSNARSLTFLAERFFHVDFANPGSPRAPSTIGICHPPMIDWGYETSFSQAEDQFQTALRAHLQNMDKLIDLQDSRLLALEQEFEMELSTLQKVCTCILRLIFLPIRHFGRYCTMQRFRARYAGRSLRSALASSWTSVFARTMTREKSCRVGKSIRLHRTRVG